MRGAIAILMLALTAGCGGEICSGNDCGSASSAGNTVQSATTPSSSSTGGTSGTTSEPDAGSGTSGSTGTPPPTCHGSAVACGDRCADLQTDTENCGACGNSCTQWLVDHHVSNSGFGAICQAGACTVVVQMPATAGTTCDAVCANAGLACVPQDSCSVGDGTFTSASFGGCGAYKDPQGFTCQAKVALGCGDVAPATETCVSSTHGSQTGTFSGGECVCG
jgi:hypothetical protein